MTVQKKKKTNKKTTAAVQKVKPAVVAKAVDVATPAAITVKKQPKVYQISAFFHSLIIVLVILLYAEWAFLTVLYFNYEVTIESKAYIQARELNIRKQRLIMKNQQKRLAQYRMEKQLAAQQAKSMTEPRGMQGQGVAPKANAAPKTATRPQFKCPAPAVRQVAFNAAEYAPFAQGGNAVVTGSVCFEMKDGNTKCFEGADVFINPVTSYSDEWYNRGWAGREFLQKADERAIQFNKMIKSGKNGAFAFEGLKGGSYYVGTAVCLPEAKDSSNCQYSRYAAKVTMKNRVKPTFKKVFP